MEGKKTIFSGIQPSGNLHLGNYLGALQNWVKIQDQYTPFFCVVDMHAITAKQDPTELNKKILELARIYLATGIDPKKATIFVQSQVPQHAELMWILGTITSVSELQKMTQFKDKSKKENSQSVLSGLMTYPILMAADILLYNTDIVPVGEDQLQHIELTRTLARRFNKKFGETFKIPNSFIKKEGMRIMGLDNPKNKMSKSAASPNNRIELLDSPDQVRDKIKKAVTDSEKTIQYTDKRPALKNLINVFSSVSGKKPLEIEKEFQGKGYKEFKEALSSEVNAFLKPFQKRYHEIPESDVKLILKNGQKKAEKIAFKKINEVKEKIGFLL